MCKKKVFFVFLQKKFYIYFNHFIINIYEKSSPVVPKDPKMVELLSQRSENDEDIGNWAVL